MLKKLPILLLLLCAGSVGSMQAQEYPMVTIEEVQFVLNPEVDDASFYMGDTVRVRGMIMSDVRSLFVGAGWACFIADPDQPSEPWQSLFIIQHDSTINGTDFGFLLPGDICTFTGVIEEFESFTQLAILTNPLVPIELEDLGSLPPPLALSTADLSGAENAEQWEGVFARIDEAEITDNNFDSNRAVIEDGSGMPTFLDDYFSFFRTMFDMGIYDWPGNGSDVGVSGFVRGLADGYSINPRNFNDLDVLSNPPAISNVLRSPLVPTSDDVVTVTSTIVDNNNVEGASLHYSVDWGEWTVVEMSSSADVWSAELPEYEDESFVRYFVSAIDNEGDESQSPGDTSLASGTIYRYVVRNTGLKIADVQQTYGYWDDASSYENVIVTLNGVVMTTPTQFDGGFFIQDEPEAWSGIRVYGGVPPYAAGDWITVTGTIEENFGWTWLGNVTFSEVLVENFGEFEPVVQQTGNLTTGGPLDEAYESVFTKFESVTVTDAQPDGQNNFGEFIIDDGSGGIRVDDESNEYEGDLGNEIVKGSFGSIQGIMIYTFSNHKLAPRNDADVDFTVGIDDEPTVPFEFVLEQNYPNPFNPETVIGYSLMVNSSVTLDIYNLAGAKIRRLVGRSGVPAANQPAGHHSVIWDGRNDAGEQVASGVYFYRLVVQSAMGRSAIEMTRKMILLR